MFVFVFNQRFKQSSSFSTGVIQALSFLTEKKYKKYTKFIWKQLPKLTTRRTQFHTVLFRIHPYTKGKHTFNRIQGYTNKLNKVIDIFIIE